MFGHRRSPRTVRFFWCTFLFVWLASGGCDGSGDSQRFLFVLDNVQQVVSGAEHSCALRTNGTVACWGSNRRGQLASRKEKTAFEVLDPIGLTTTTTVDYRPYAQVIAGLTKVKTIAAGDFYTCALLSNSTVRCWGDSEAGQLGNGDYSLDDCDGRPCSREPVEVKGLKDATALALGSSVSCAIHGGGHLSCWGGSAVGVNPKTLDRCNKNPCATHPVSVAPDKKVTQIAVGSAHGCFITEDGSVACWGDNQYGQIGVRGQPAAAGDNTSIATPVNLPSQVSLPGAADTLMIAKNASTTCVRLEDSSFYCWGRNDVGQLGIGNVQQTCTTGSGSASPCAATPHKLANLDDGDRYFIGQQHACALSTQGALYCWGFGLEGQLGVEKDGLETCGAGYLCATAPIAFSSTPTVTDVGLGQDFTCILNDENAVKCFGWGYHEELIASGAKNFIDCNARNDGCEVNLSGDDVAKQLVLTHLNRLCVLTQKGELHCLKEFNPATRKFASEPVWITK